MLKRPQQNAKQLKPLPPNVRSLVRSGIAIASVSQCVEELVYNAIDAKAKTIIVSVNIDLFNVRVEDDGVGLSEVDLEAVGERYTTSKCHSLEDLNKLKFYGYRGEALASIIEVSATVHILTRPKDVGGMELRKRFENGKVQGFAEKLNTSNEKSGTTVIITSLLSKLPVRQKRIDTSIQIEEVKKSLENIILINPHLNVVLKNDKDNTRILDYAPSNSYSEAFDKLHQSRLGFQVNFVEEHFLYKNLFFTLGMSNEFCRKRYYQFVYVNNRFIQRCKIHKLVGQNILEIPKGVSSPKVERYPVFILNITCSLTDYDITVDPKKQTVEFKNWEVVQIGLDGLLNKFRGKNVAGCSKANHISDKDLAKCTSFDVKGALHSRFVARKEAAPPEINSNLSDASTGEKSQSSEGWRQRNRNLTRTGSSSHVVNVRELRRKRKTRSSDKGGAITISNNFDAPKRANNNKPKVTLEVFQKFPEWRKEFNNKNDSPGVDEMLPYKKPRLNDGVAFAQRPPLFNYKVNSEPENPIPPPSCKSTFNWKINRFLESHEAEEMDLFSVESYSPIPSVSSSRKSVPRSVVHQDDQQQRRCKSEEPSYNDPHPSTLSLEKLYVADVLALLDTFVDTELEVTFTKKALLDRISSTKTALKSRKIRRNSAPACTNSSCNFKSSNIILKSQSENARKSHSLDSNLGHFALAPSKLSSTAVETPGNNIPFFMSFVSANSSPPKLPPQLTDAAWEPSFLQQPPPLLNLYPCQKIFTSEWNDKMLNDNYVEESDLFPSDDVVEIVSDVNGQEWLQNVDSAGKIVYINLSTGEFSDHIVHVFGTLKKTSLREIKKANPVRYTWLTRHFPQGFRQFWDGSSGRDVQKDGDFSKIGNSLIRDSVLKCFEVREKQSAESKWKTEETKDVETMSSYFNTKESTSVTVPEKVPETKRIPQPPEPVKITSIRLQAWKSFAAGTSSMRFTREDFKNVNVMGQLDNKFIVATLSRSLSIEPTLVIFDQHAVHERIRLEDFIKESSRISRSMGKKYLVSYKVTPPLVFYLSDSDVRVMLSYRDFFAQNGVVFDLVNSTSVKVISAPKCFYEKMMVESANGRENCLQSLIHKLIQELIQHLMTTKGAGLTGLPKTVNEVLCSQACHGAIKFGDSIDHPTCKKLIADLALCKYPFQCAHGRPTVAPLINASDLAKSAGLGSSFNRQPIPATVCDRKHLECSIYFCNPDEEKTSGYFGLNDADESDEESPYFFVLKM